jgi:hypothetical protein
MKKIENIVDNIIGLSLDTKSIVVCVGAGISLYKDAPAQDEVVNQLSKLVQYKINQWTQNDIEFLYEYTTNQLGRDTVISQITKFYKELRPSELHQALAKSAINLFITTNFDTLLENAMQKENVEYEVITYDTDAPILESQKAETLALTRLDQGTLKKSRAQLQDLGARLRDLVRFYLTNNLVLFIGYDLDIGLRDFYERFGVQSSPLNNWVVLTTKINSLDRRLWSQRGVKLFEIKNELLPSFINKLSVKISEPEKEILTSKREKQVFISGGLKDRKLRNSVLRYLREAGYQPVILRAEPSEGRTLLEKLNTLIHESEAAIVILDEEERLSPTVQRARQNLLFELGFLMGSLGRERVGVIQSVQQNLPTTLVGSELFIYDPQKPSQISRPLINWLKHL